MSKRSLFTLFRRSRSMMMAAVLLLAAGFLSIGGLAGSPRSVSAAANCGGQELAGRWINRAKQEGSDLLSADIQIPCTSPAAAAGRVPPAQIPRIDLQLTVRCLHFLACDWQSTPATWVPTDHRDGGLVLSAHLDQERFDRSVTVEPLAGGKLKVTLVSRFKGLVLEPVKTIYTLERARA